MRGAAKKRMNQSYQQYQLQHQPREAAREWDLNDPNHLKKTQVRFKESGFRHSVYMSSFFFATRGFCGFHHNGSCHHF